MKNTMNRACFRVLRERGGAEQSGQLHPVSPRLLQGQQSGRRRHVRRMRALRERLADAGRRVDVSQRLHPQYEWSLFVSLMNVEQHI